MRLHLAECAEVHREIYAEHRDAYDDDLHAKMAVGLAVAPEERASLVAGLHAWRAAVRRAAARWDVLVSPVFPGELPASDVPATIELTDRMTAYTRPVNWLGWPSAVTADGVMHTGRDEAARAVPRPGVGGGEERRWRTVTAAARPRWLRSAARRSCG